MKKGQQEQKEGKRNESSVCFFCVLLLLKFTAFALTTSDFFGDFFSEFLQDQ